MGPGLAEIANHESRISEQRVAGPLAMTLAPTANHTGKAKVQWRFVIEQLAGLGQRLTAKTEGGKLGAPFASICVGRCPWGGVLKSDPVSSCGSLSSNERPSVSIFQKPGRSHGGGALS